MNDVNDNAALPADTQTPAPVPPADAPAVVQAAEGAEPAQRRRSRRGGKGRNRPAPAAADGAAAKDNAAAPQDGGARQGAAAPAAKARGQRGQRGNGKPNPVLERLFQLYPALFGARFLPLKRGVYEDIVARHGSEFEPEALKAAMGMHARSTRYLECVANGLPRHDLDGQVVEPMAPEHVHHALIEVFKRRQQRSGQDLGVELRARLAKAIEASGLSREDYQLRMRTRDEAANAALDDAMVELGRQAARREALLRAFEASGKSEAEFADMYGMAPAEVARTLKRVRQDQALAEAARIAAAAVDTAEAAQAADAADAAPAPSPSAPE